MSKYNARITVMVRKTHQFVSHKELCRTCDYLKDWFDRSDKPPDLEKKVIELLELNQEILQSNDPVRIDLYRKTVRDHPAIWLKSIIPEVDSFCEYNQNGIWLEKVVAEFFKNYAKRLRD